MKKEFKRYYTFRETRLKLKPNSIVIYDKYHTDYLDNRRRHDISQERWAEKGNMSKSIKKRITSRATILVNTLIFGKSKRRPIFVTLTLPSQQQHTDRECTKMFTRWVDYIGRLYPIRNYVYRVEKQKNGNCHYHIILDCYVPYNELNRTWCMILERTGYVSRYRINNNKADNVLPNCTDVRAIRNAKEAVGYIAKYIKKDVEGEELKVDGRVWGCSDNLANAEEPSIVVTPAVERELRPFMQFAMKFDYCSILEIIPSNITTPVIWAAYEKAYQKFYRAWYYTHAEELFTDKQYQVEALPAELQN